MEETIPTVTSSAIFYVEIIAALTIPASFVVVVFHRLKSQMGMGYRSIQFLALGTVMPIVMILALEGKLAGEAVAAIIGGIVGYLFTSAAKPTKASADS